MVASRRRRAASESIESTAAKEDPSESSGANVSDDKQAIDHHNGGQQGRMSTRNAACFKCGELSHKAADCESPKLCYNCRAPGHESSECPEEHTNENKQCYRCAGVGHVAADCPEAPTKIKLPRPAVARGGFNGLPARGGGSGGGRIGMAGRGRGAGRGGMMMMNGNGGAPMIAGKTCYACGGFGHIAAQCPTAARAAGSVPPQKRPQVAANGQPVTCRRCGGENHFARDCLATIKPEDKACFRCHEKGHIARECPTIADAAGAISTKQDSTDEVAAIEARLDQVTM